MPKDFKYRRDGAAHRRRTGQRLYCPSCYSATILYRRKAKQWWCRRCGHEFTVGMVLTTALPEKER